jgi:phosphopantetheinyl transferase (holo-ACP synthase)
LRSIGNDIIALQLTNPERTKQQKFYSKIICGKEFELFKSLKTDLLLENFVWLCWSIKESAYKFLKRNNAELLFSPTKIIIQKIRVPENIFFRNNNKHEAVSFDDEFCFCCEVSFNDYTFFTRSLLHDDLIFTVANNRNDFENIYWGIKSIDDDCYKNQSKEVRQFLLERMNIIFSEERLSIETSDVGFPFLKQQKDLPISFTHHGNFVAYSFINSCHENIQYKGVTQP